MTLDGTAIRRIRGKAAAALAVATMLLGGCVADGDRDMFAHAYAGPPVYAPAYRTDPFLPFDVYGRRAYDPWGWPRHGYAGDPFYDHRRGYYGPGYRDPCIRYKNGSPIVRELGLHRQKAVRVC